MKKPGNKVKRTILLNSVLYPYVAKYHILLLLNLYAFSSYIYDMSLLSSCYLYAVPKIISLPYPAFLKIK